MENKYSVLMSLYKKENPNYLRLALDSIINQTIKPNEIVLVEDGPLTDKLYKVIDEYKNKYPKHAEALNNRYSEYNEQIKFCEELEKNGDAIIIRPTIKMDISRFERNKDKLKEIYQNGYELVIKSKEKILNYIE